MTELRACGWAVLVGVLMFVVFVLVDAVMFADPPAVDSPRGQQVVAELRCKFQGECDD